jgi:tRNA (mo5U34)-methyltransferase
MEIVHEELWHTINSTRWFHRFELVPGVTTPGRVPVNAGAALNGAGLSENLGGIRVLDVGAADGAYSFEFARRGASVLAIDLELREGFKLANQLVPKAVEHRIMSAYDLSVDSVGRFDVVWFWGVFYHLREPLLVFRNLHRILRDGGRLCFEGEVLDGAPGTHDPRLINMQQFLDALQAVPLTYFTSGSYNGDRTNWFVPNKTCLQEWVKASGFKEISIRLNPKRTRAYGTAIKNPEFDNIEYGRIDSKR